MRQTLGGGLVVLLVGSLAAADPADPAAFDKLVRDALQDVHNRGADLYNAAKDYPGAYRLYEGSLRTVGPLLGHRPSCQSRIADGLAAAEKEADPARRAFRLHEAIEAVRAELKTPLPAAKKAEPKPPEPKPAEKEPNPPEVMKKEPAPLKPADPAPADGAAGEVAGRITSKGQPLAGADVTFVTLDRPAPKVVSATTGEDGTFAAEGLPAGRYVVTVAAKGGKPAVPAKYATTDTSGITAEVKAGPNALDLNLQ
ncbi:MAG: carboxypeptidase-like regulatory domain-containing protein [Gemmataceae bacterium]|nr:carboxypeptidase-like regulatory domain-containing protein [Gemmataceae bacterium]